MELWMELHVLHQHGWTVSALGRHFKINRRTVSRQLDAQSAAGARTAVRRVDPAGRSAVYRGTSPLRIIASLTVPVGGKVMVAGSRN